MEICKPFLTLANLSHLLKRDLTKDQIWQGETKVDVEQAKKYGHIRSQVDHCRPVTYLVLPENEAFRIKHWLLLRHPLRILYPSFLDATTAAADGVKGDRLYTTIYALETKVDKACQLLKAEQDDELEP